MAHTIENTQLPFWKRVVQCVKDTIKPAFSTIRFLLLVMLAVSFAILILKSTGLLHYIAAFMNPLMRFLELPGEAALAYLSSIFMNIYSAIAVIKTLDLSGRQLIILATMCLIAHNFFVECVLMKKTGSSFRKMVLLRIVTSLAAAWILGTILPPDPQAPASAIPPQAAVPELGFNIAQFVMGLGPWIKESLFLILQIFLIVFAVMLFQRVLTEFGIIKKLGKIARPIMGVFGLSPNSAYVWFIANTIGLVYGSGVIVEELSDGTLSRVDADLFNHHAAISHSQIEDTLLFVSMGVPYAWAALPRFALAIVIVWIERARRAIFRSSFRVKVV